MNRMNLTGIAAAMALAGLVPACGCPMAEGAANSPTPTNMAPESNAAVAPEAADTTAAAPAPAPADTTAAAAAAPGAAAAGSATPPAPGAPAAGGEAAAAPAAGAAAAAAPAAGTGTISGQITATPAKFGGKHVVVWLNSGGLPAKQVTVEIDQKNMKFLPLVTAVPSGSRVIFRNSDPFPHNVFTSEGDKFNLGMMPANSARVHVFKKTGPYTLLCQIHPGMIAYVYVVPSKFYAVADDKGNYTIKNVPNGSYKLSAWAPKLAVATTDVTVSGAAATASLHLKRGN